MAQKRILTGNGSIKALLNSRFVLFMVVVTLMNVTNFMVNPTLTIAANAIGASASMIGVITSVMGLTSFLLMVIVGPATVTFAPHKLLAVSCFGYAASYFMLATNSIPFFIAAKITEGFFAAFLVPPSIIILRDCISFDQVSTAMGVFQIRNSFAKIVGPILGLNLLVKLVGYQKNFIICGIMFVIYGVISLCCFKLRNTEFTPKPFRLNPQNIISKGGLIPMVITFLFCTAHMALGYFNNVYAATELGLSNVGTILAVGNTFAVIFGPIFSSYADKIGIKKVLIPTIIMFTVSPYIWSIAQGMVACCIAAALQFTAFSTFVSLMTAHMVKRAGVEGSGLAGNTFTAGQNLGSFVGGLLTGQLVQFFGYRSMYRYMIIVPVITLIVTLVYFAKNPETDADQETPAASA